jgi:uncharacterized membrane protein YhiD involved in acid resistance
MQRPITFLYFALFLLEALVLGAIIGVERQWRQRTAGLRTNALVSAGAAGPGVVACFHIETIASSFFRNQPRGSSWYSWLSVMVRVIGH